MQAILQKKSSKFTSLFTGDSTAFNNYLISVDLRIKGEWKNAGDRLVRCAEQYAGLRMFLEAAAVYYEAGDCYLKVDKDEAQKAWASAVKTFCDLNMYEVSGRIEKRIADLHFSFKHWEDAALHYRKAANFMLSDPEQSDHCLEKSAEALVHNGDCNQSHLVYENLALSCWKTNLRSFQANTMLMMAIISLFGSPVVVNLPVDEQAGKKKQQPHQQESVFSKPDVLATYQRQYRVKYDEIRQKIEEYNSFTSTWEASKERLFIKNLLSFRTEENYALLVDHIYYWNNLRPLSSVALMMLKVPVDEVTNMMQRREAIAKIEAEAAAKAAAEGKSKKLIPSKT